MTLTKQIFSRRMLITFFLGMSSGIPLLAIGSTLQAWMKDEQVDLSVIGLFSLIGLPYTLKFLWAPLIDRYVPPFLGRRRGWMLITQIGLAALFVGLAVVGPKISLELTALLAFLIAFVSASQDIVLDAHRRDTLSDAELGFGSSLFVNGYRIGMLVSGAGALSIADLVSWRVVYLLIGMSMGVGIITTFLAPEPTREPGAPTTLRDAIIRPLAEYFSRPGAITILLFILMYKLGDSLASAMTTPYILEIGFTKAQLAAIAKTLGLAATLGGGLLGGALLLRISIIRALLYFGFLQAFTILGFSLLIRFGADTTALAAVITLENFTSGLGTSAYVAFMGSLCNRSFSATQYALLSSLAGIPRVLLSSPTGFLASGLGWEGYFIFCTFAAIPGLVLLRALEVSQKSK